MNLAPARNRGSTGTQVAVLPGSFSTVQTDCNYKSRTRRRKLRAMGSAEVQVQLQLQVGVKIQVSVQPKIGMRGAGSGSPWSDLIKPSSRKPAQINNNCID